MTDDLLRSARWRRLREQVLKRDNYTDQVMKRYGKRITATTVHHIFPREFYPELTFEPWNLISVSHITHNALHDRESHLLTAKGWELLQRTARHRGIIIDDSVREKLLTRGKSSTPPHSDEKI